MAITAEMFLDGAFRSPGADGTARLAGTSQTTRDGAPRQMSQRPSMGTPALGELRRGEPPSWANGSSGIALTPDEVVATLDHYRAGIATFDAAGILIYANRHFDYMYRNSGGLSQFLGWGFGDILERLYDNTDLIGFANRHAFEQWRNLRLESFSGTTRKPSREILVTGQYFEARFRRVPDGKTIGLWTRLPDNGLALNSDVETSDKLAMAMAKATAPAGVLPFDLSDALETELRSLITTIIGFGEILKEGLSSQSERRLQLSTSEGGDYAGHIVESGYRLQDLLSQVVYRPFSAGQTPEDIDLHALLQDIIPRLSGLVVNGQPALIGPSTEPGLIVRTNTRIIRAALDLLFEVAADMAQWDIPTQLSAEKTAKRSVALVMRWSFAQTAEQNGWSSPYGLPSQAPLKLRMAERLIALTNGDVLIHVEETLSVTVHLPAARTEMNSRQEAVPPF